MKKGSLHFVLVLLGYVQSETTGSWTFWVEDMTPRFQTDKRTSSGLDLADHLTFRLRRGSDVFTLNLERNHDIKPNTDMYFLRNVRNGRFRIVKSRDLKKKNLAYYQDRDNGASMIVRCFKRSSEYCDRVINGNLRIGDTSYELRPADGDVTSRNVFEGLTGKRYILQNIANIRNKHSVEIKDAGSFDVKNKHQKHIALRSHGQCHMISSRNIAGLDNRVATSDKNYSDKNDKEEKTRWLAETYYYVDFAVLVDSTIWDLYASTVSISNMLKKSDAVKQKIRESYSHIVNGVNMLYKGIKKPKIRITLSAFIFFQQDVLFPHNSSKVIQINGKTLIDVFSYHDDLTKWDAKHDAKCKPTFDHGMLFTRHNLYKVSIENNAAQGLCWTGGVCIPGKRTSVVQTQDYVATVLTAAHELGHSLGAPHDGEYGANDCDATDLFIMSPVDPNTFRTHTRPYERNRFLFSHCSVRWFKKTLKNKDCVENKGKVFNETEWKIYMAKMPGEVYTPDQQCHLINGPKSVYCGTVLSDICHLMQCTDPNTRQCMKRYFSAATGTKCGNNMWCVDGLCVRKGSK